MSSVQNYKHIISNMNATRRYLKQQYRLADANSSGYLDYDEVRELCKGLNIKLDREELRILFNEANTEKTDPASKDKGEVKILKRNTI